MRRCFSRSRKLSPTAYGVIAFCCISPTLTAYCQPSAVEQRTPAVQETGPALATGFEVSSSEALKTSTASITGEELLIHVATLADEEFEGREAGKTGGKKAGAYIIGRLQEMGLNPAGTDGAYEQPFTPNYRNILAVLHGSDPDKKNEVIVIGAH